MGWFSRLLGLEDDERDRRPQGRPAPTYTLTPTPTPPGDGATTTVAGPAWMGANEWAKRLEAYTRQGRSAADIRRVVAHLEKRGPAPTRAEQVTRAKAHGYVAREEYMPPDVEAKALTLDADGKLDARLVRVRNRLVVVTPYGWVNPRTRSAYKVGLHSVITRGTAYHGAAVKAGRFIPGALVRLEREPHNKHDPNAIAVYAENARRKSGYVPRGAAKRLAKLIDGGADLVAVSVLGNGPGVADVNPQLLICERALLEHLTRHWPTS